METMILDVVVSLISGLVAKYPTAAMWMAAIGATVVAITPVVFALQKVVPALRRWADSTATIADDQAVEVFARVLGFVAHALEWIERVLDRFAFVRPRPADSGREVSDNG